MASSFFTGFILGISLILAIGAQNAFVLRQGILRQHVFIVAIFCAITDAFLICIGIVGISFFFEAFIVKFSDLLFGISSIWLFGYGAIRFWSAFKSKSKIEIELSTPGNLVKILSILVLITFANPHVYLDTVILIGSISQQFSGEYKIAFAIGASLASFVFFFTLAYGARFIAPLMQKTFSWRILDFLIGFIMISIAYTLALKINWF